MLCVFTSRSSISVRHYILDPFTPLPPSFPSPSPLGRGP